MASTWLSDHQERPSAPTNSLHKLHMARCQVLLTIVITITIPVVLLNTENMGITVGISLLSQIRAEVCIISYLFLVTGRHL